MRVIYGLGAVILFSIVFYGIFGLSASCDDVKIISLAVIAAGAMAGGD